MILGVSLQHRQLQVQKREVLLGAVVEIAFHAASLVVGDRDDASPRGLHVPIVLIDALNHLVEGVPHLVEIIPGEGRQPDVAPTSAAEALQRPSELVDATDERVLDHPGDRPGEGGAQQDGSAHGDGQVGVVTQGVRGSGADGHAVEQASETRRKRSLLASESPLLTEHEVIWKLRRDLTDDWTQADLPEQVDDGRPADRLDHHGEAGQDVRDRRKVVDLRRCRCWPREVARHSGNGLRTPCGSSATDVIHSSTRSASSSSRRYLIRDRWCTMTTQSRVGTPATMPTSMTSNSFGPLADLVGPHRAQEPDEYRRQQDELGEERAPDEQQVVPRLGAAVNRLHPAVKTALHVFWHRRLSCALQAPTGILLPRVTPRLSIVTEGAQIQRCH